jgi:argininosuccinate synthase
VPEHFTLSFEKGVPSKLVIGDETITDSLALFKRLNQIGYEHGR